MCLGGGSTVSSGAKMGVVTDDSGNQYYVEQGVPADYAKRGVTTVVGYQTLAAQDLSDKQIAAQRDIADEEEAFNEKQYNALQDQYTQQQTQADEQATRQTDYDTGRAKLLDEGTKTINDAFAGFTDKYYTDYAKNYMAKAQDDIDYQKKIAQKNLAFGLARQGLSSSQAGVNEGGLLEETAGRATASQTANSLASESTLKSDVSKSKQNLLTQVGTAESLGAPIAGKTTEAVNAALDTTKSAISGVTSTAGDTVSSLVAEPTVSSLSNIFSNVLGSTGSLISGINANTIGNYAKSGLAGTDYKTSSTSG